jgi:DNA helicase-2/ATP-dependent DNA helicase PcrA
MDQLNPKQQEAVETTEGRIKVVAGAGSGKTRVLAHRYAYLVNELGIDPGNLLCMTFTNKAAQEMKMRIASLISAGNINDFVTTIHGFCVKFLRQEIFRIGFPKNFQILDDEDAKGLVEQVLEEQGIGRTVATVRQVLHEIEATKNANPSAYITNFLDGDVSPEKSVKYESSFALYMSLQLKYFLLDFDDLVYVTIYILEKFPSVLSFWQDKLNYVMVDEAQDCSQVEWQLIELLVGKYQNLFVVGDPDQCIYEWRGAKPKSFIALQVDRQIVLNQNYRSTPNILNVANSVISHNKDRIPKDLFTQREAGKVALHYHAKSENSESKWVAKQIANMRKHGANYSDFAILYRSSYLSRNIEQALVRQSIPYTVWGGVRFFDRREIKDAIAYLRLLVIGDDLSFRRIINVPSRKFGKASMNKLQEMAERKDATLFETLKSPEGRLAFNKPSIRKFIQLFDDAEAYAVRHSISDLMEFMLRESGLKDEVRMDEDEDRLENLNELIESIKYYEQSNAEEEDLSVARYLQDVALYTNADYKKDEPTVKLMTIHQAKGLEFPYVFVVGLSEGIFPNHRSIRERKKAGEEEERRLMYVAVTRAENVLFLTESEGFSSAAQGSKYPSRFLLEIKPGLLEVKGKIDPALFEGTRKLVEQVSNVTMPKPAGTFEVGELVVHKVFGKGIVVDADGERDSYKVKFENGERNLLGRALKKFGD